MTKCLIKKPFPFSEDGFTTKAAGVGEVRTDIPASSIPGLKAEGYIEIVEGEAAPVTEAKDAGPAPENKMEPDAAPENKAPENQSEDDAKVVTAKLRAEYADLKGKRPFSGWSDDDLREKIAELKAKAGE